MISTAKTITFSAFAKTGGGAGATLDEMPVGPSARFRTRGCAANCVGKDCGVQTEAMCADQRVTRAASTNERVDGSVMQGTVSETSGVLPGWRALQRRLPYALSGFVNPNSFGAVPVRFGKTGLFAPLPR